MVNLWAHVTWKFDGRTKKTIGHLLYTMPSSVHDFKAIGEFKLELQSGNSQFGSKLVIFLSPVTLKFDEWPWKTIGHIFSDTSSVVHHFIAINQFKIELQSGNTQLGSKSATFVLCDLEIWWMTLKDNRAPLLCYFKICASFHSHLWNQNEVTVRKHQIWVKISNFLSCVTLKFYRWPWKTIGHLFYATSSSVHHFIAICEFKMELQSGNSQFGSKSAIFCPVWPWNLTDDLGKQ